MVVSKLQKNRYTKKQSNNKEIFNVFLDCDITINKKNINNYDDDDGSGGGGGDDGDVDDDNVDDGGGGGLVVVVVVVVVVTTTTTTTVSKDFREQPTLLVHWTDRETNMSGFSDLGLIIEIDWKVNSSVYLLCLPALSAWSLAKQCNLRVTLSAKATSEML